MAFGYVTFGRSMSDRRCQCPCDQELPTDARENRRYIDERHKARARRARLREALKAAGLPTNLNLEVAHTMGTASNRDGAGKTRSPRRQRQPRAGVTVYLPRLEVAQAVLALIDPDGHARHEELSVGRDALLKAIERKQTRA